MKKKSVCILCLSVLLFCNSCIHNGIKNLIFHLKYKIDILLFIIQI